MAKPTYTYQQVPGKLSDLAIIAGLGTVVIVMGTLIGWAAYLTLSVVATVVTCAFFMGANRAA
jgi:hypothetical protein